VRCKLHVLRGLRLQRNVVLQIVRRNAVSILENFQQSSLRRTHAHAKKAMSPVGCQRSQFVRSDFPRSWN
jgi:hypothetical protein